MFLVNINEVVGVDNDCVVEFLVNGEGFERLNLLLCEFVFKKLLLVCLV